MVHNGSKAVHIRLYKSSVEEEQINKTLTFHFCFIPIRENALPSLLQLHRQWNYAIIVKGRYLLTLWGSCLNASYIIVDKHGNYVENTLTDFKTVPCIYLYV